ncbi:aspartate kinase [Tepidibacter thalassicus]|uniref:Aspartokinase n=1 Tax=Tepidibacter thalassicus DSM 15285 TaxID=1123350 RepID=A0A1M5NXJ0_9FIRM|nr:aspartate kinase [Tepidibacter thalassicus]SHG93889.1 aspartate kinase [Tepidibacter thalassicus DSM 15285]
MNILVQKFGGTSVESYEKMIKVSRIIKEYKDNGYDLVVVVSAMGRKGAPYATDTLIQLCRQVNEDVSLRELDLIMSCGEIISGSILVNVLKNIGIDSVLLTGAQAGIITNGKYGDSTVIDVDVTRIYDELSRGRVVVVTGFQGITKDGEITTLGRGGSDTSAVIIGKGLGAKFVEIYTDVDGIMTADPKIEPNAKIIKNIDYDEVFQMAEKGAKVIHPRAVEIAKNGNIVLRIKNTLGSKEGTNICSYNVTNIDSYKINDKNLITAIAHKNDIVQVMIKNCKDDMFTDILNEIEKNDISIDMINFFVGEKVFTIDANKLKVLKSILESYNVDYDVVANCSKVTLIGSRINGIPGVMAKIVKALSKKGIKILQTSDSHMTISCLINEKDLKDAVNALHEEFGLFEK